MTTDATTLPAVHVVDDDDNFRISMTRLLEAAGLAAVGYRCAGDFLIARSLGAQGGEISGCIILDISMPGPSGIELLKALMHRELPPPVIFVTARDDVLTSVDALKAGAFDYLVKPVGAERILPAVRRAMQVDADRRDQYRQLEELRRRFATLTESERAIFHGIMRDQLNKQIAAARGACERTIKSQRAKMMHKLELSTLPDLVRAARMLERVNGA